MRRLALSLFVLANIAHAADVHVRVSPDVTTGIAGTDAFPTIQNALDHHPFATPNPDGTPGRVFIEIAPGTYHERVIVTQNHTNITLLGMGKTPAETIITNGLNAKQAGGTFFTETVEINGDGFEADNLTFENSAGNTGQAVAAAVRADRVIFKHCRFLGHQDTLFADFGRQYYVDSYLEGGVDYIFGNATAVFERDELHSNGPGAITAQSRTSADQTTGFVILNSRVTAAIQAPVAVVVIPRAVPGIQRSPPAGGIYAPPGGFYNDGVLHSTDQKPKTAAPSPPPVQAAPGAGSAAIKPASGSILLGRPWRPYARTVFLNTELPAELNPAGWNNWGNPANEATAWYAEFGSSGAGAPRSDASSPRVPWAHQLTAGEAEAFLPEKFLAGPKTGPGHWDPIAETAKLP